MAVLVVRRVSFEVGRVALKHCFQGWAVFEIRISNTLSILYFVFNCILGSVFDDFI